MQISRDISRTAQSHDLSVLYRCQLDPGGNSSLVRRVISPKGHLSEKYRHRVRARTRPSRVRVRIRV